MGYVRGWWGCQWLVGMGYVRGWWGWDMSGVGGEVRGWWGWDMSGFGRDVRGWWGWDMSGVGGEVRGWWGWDMSGVGGDVSGWWGWDLSGVGGDVSGWWGWDLSELGGDVSGWWGWDLSEVGGDGICQWLVGMGSVRSWWRWDLSGVAYWALRSLRCKENKLKIKELIKSNRIISIKDLSSETGLSVGLCHQIVTKDLDMIRASSKFVPRILTEEQKECIIVEWIYKNMVEMTRTYPEWMQKIITGDETWVYRYDPETKRQSSQWIERGEPEAVRLKRPERWQNNGWILHVDNARSHTAHVVLQFLAKHSTIQIPHPPYSPDLAPNDFSLYPKLKMKLKGREFDNVDMIQAESKATLRNLSKNDFISCFDNCLDFKSRRDPEGHASLGSMRLELIYNRLGAHLL
ncbi:hypothetical protein LAZ67_11000534 [Cordylochernes scorpioides]|uniref:Transposase n=1 Tax=Cordylochernes scorpioides TaxID=51811 RepID=A0ABY6L0N9_9ARAC|nr:hypothetical protein LAZ67_11000534 [Cordylochernes scorpioides]